MRCGPAMDLLIGQASAPSMKEVKQKEFQPKHGIEKLKDYSVAPAEDFWKQFPKMSWQEAQDTKCGIDHGVLWELGRQVDYPDMASLQAACRDLEHGARLGVSTEHYMASSSTNAISALECGEEVTDALAGWVHSKFAMGPFDPDEVPFEMIRKSGLMTKKKPDGSVRIIVNLSKGKPHAVNEGIDKKKYHTRMSSTEEWVRILWRCGRDSRFCKIDWKEKRFR